MASKREPYFVRSPTKKKQRQATDDGEEQVATNPNASNELFEPGRSPTARPKSPYDNLNLSPTRKEHR